MFPGDLKFELKKFSELRYGENPHQKGAFYIDPKSRDRLAIQNFKKFQGKELSFNNLLDIDAAIFALSQIGAKQPACLILKHGNPCGAAYGKDIKTAFLRAWNLGDFQAAFGGVVIVNRPVKKIASIMLGRGFFEILLAPEVAKNDLKIFSEKKNLIILINGALKNPHFAPGLDCKKIRGGWLLQEFNKREITAGAFKIATKRKPTKREIRDLLFAWKICKVSKSNAVCLVKNEALAGSGVGQQSRVKCCKLAVFSAGVRANGAAAASDAFFPFSDGPETLAKAGITAIIQPGGSLYDQKTINLCNKYKIAMVFSGVRCFKH